MSDGLGIKPVIHAEVAINRATSSCCDAKLHLAAVVGNEHRYQCTRCWQPCERVMSDPERMTING